MAASNDRSLDSTPQGQGPSAGPARSSPAPAPGNAAEGRSIDPARGERGAGLAERILSASSLAGQGVSRATGGPGGPARAFVRAQNEDDDGYDPYSDRPADTPAWEEDPWS